MKNKVAIFGIVVQLAGLIYGIVNKAPEIYAPTILLLVGVLYIIYTKLTTKIKEDETKK